MRKWRKCVPIGSRVASFCVTKVASTTTLVFKTMVLVIMFSLSNNTKKYVINSAAAVTFENLTTNNNPLTDWLIVEILCNIVSVSDSLHSTANSVANSFIFVFKELVAFPNLNVSTNLPLKIHFDDIARYCSLYKISECYVN